MRVGVIGLNHKIADLGRRENFAKHCYQLFNGGKAIDSDHSFVLLLTCNRVEVYFSSHDLANTHTCILNMLRQCMTYLEDSFDQKLYSYFGHDCFKHLVRVAAGLDSAIVAETEIQNQVKNAYDSAREYYRFPSDMHYLFQKALKIVKQIRNALPLGRGVPDLEHAILSVGARTFPKPEEAKILFVGISDINRKIVTFLAGKNFENLTLCNRTPQTAWTLAEKYNLATINWSQMSEWHHFDWIIFGTRSPDYLITRRDVVQRSISHKLIIDLCVPRNVEPNLSSDARITLLNIDELNLSLDNRKKQMAHLLTKAEDLVHSSTQRHICLWRDKIAKREYLENYCLTEEFCDSFQFSLAAQ